MDDRDAKGDQEREYLLSVGEFQQSMAVLITQRNTQGSVPDDQGSSE